MTQPETPWKRANKVMLKNRFLIGKLGVLLNITFQSNVEWNRLVRPPHRLVVLGWKMTYWFWLHIFKTCSRQSNRSISGLYVKNVQNNIFLFLNIFYFNTLFIRLFFFIEMQTRNFLKMLNLYLKIILKSSLPAISLLKNSIVEF